MSPDRVKLLNEIPSWKWDSLTEQKRLRGVLKQEMTPWRREVIEAIWQEGYQKTLRRYEETGDYRANWKDVADTAMYNWQITQRRAYRNGELAPERVKLLNAIPSWSWDLRPKSGPPDLQEAA
jgi:hypothetical protein